MPGSDGGHHQLAVAARASRANLPPPLEGQTAMFEGFNRTEIEPPPSVFGGARIHLRHGADGPPLLLLHGNPMTHVMWHKIANRLAEHFHLVCAALRGLRGHGG